MNPNRLKRGMDLALAVPGLILSLPLQAAIATVVRRTLGRPVLFRQVRPGLHGKPFEMIKFRTMLPVDFASGHTNDASRMTHIGRILRATSLDELPSLWNVVRGDMSLVGPRPLLMSYLDRYTPAQARRHDVRPGLTGPVQVSGRNSLTWDEKFTLDVDYVANHSLAGDLRILLRTVLAVVGGRGVRADGEATMPEFSPGESRVAADG